MRFKIEERPVEGKCKMCFAEGQTYNYKNCKLCFECLTHMIGE